MKMLIMHFAYNDMKYNVKMFDKMNKCYKIAMEDFYGKV